MPGTLRPLYGRGALQPVAYGDPAGLMHLRGTRHTTRRAVTTLLVDIEGSTRLGVRHPLETVAGIKNTLLTTMVQTARAFDGHVHRLMGDSMLAFFGLGEDESDAQGALNALNAGATLCFLSERVLGPVLKEEGLTEPPGLRVGIDYAAQETCLWRSFGYPGMEEVTATSYYVDVVARLQRVAGRNQLMAGDALQRLLRLPAGLLRVKHVERDGASVPRPVVLPNHTDGRGRRVDYRQHLVPWARFLSLGPMASHDPAFFAERLRRKHVLPVTASRGGEPIVPCSLQLPVGTRVHLHGPAGARWAVTDLAGEVTPLAEPLLELSTPGLQVAEATVNPGVGYLAFLAE